MSLVVVIGWSATAAGALLGVPQLLRLIRTRRLEGLSLLAWCATFAVNVSWLAHGIHIGQPPQIVTNSIALCSTLSILVLLARSLGRPLVRVIAPALAVAGAIIATDLLIGSLAFGLVAVIPGVFSYLSQGLELVRSERVTGVSAVFLTMAAVNQTLWLTWASLIHDPGTLVACTLTLTMTGFNLLWYTLRRIGLRALLVPAAAPAVAPRRPLALTRG